jgi:hypothetical protein
MMLSNSPFTLYNPIGYRGQIIVVQLDQRAIAVKITSARMSDNPNFFFPRRGVVR